MAGLREKKKILTRESILTAAAHCFATQGYEGASMEEIASLAAIAVGTVYNYFPSKRDVLFALFESDLERHFNTAAEVAAKRIDDPADATFRLLSVYVDALNEIERRVWREGFSVAMSEGADTAPFWYDLHDGISDQIEALLERCRNEGLLGQVVSIDTAQRLVLSVFISQILQFVANDAIKVSEMKERLRREIYLTFRGLR